MCESYAGFNVMPFFQATSATGACGMLSDEDRMAFHRGLATVIWDDGGSKPQCNHFIAMSCNRFKAFFLDVLHLLALEVPAHPEVGVG